MRQFHLLGHQILDLADSRLVEETVLGPNSQGQWDAHRVEVSGDCDQTRVTSHGSIDAANVRPATILLLTMGLQNSVTTTPAKANSTNLVGARRHANGVDETINERLANSFRMLGEPSTQGRRHNCRVLCLVYHRKALLRLDVGLDIIEETRWQRIPV